MADYKQRTPLRPEPVISRRRLMRYGATAGAGAAVMAALGCGTRHASSPASSSAGGAAHPRSGGTLRRRTVTSAFSGGFDPHVQAGSQTGEMGFFYQGLVRLNPSTIAVESEIAQKWEQPSATDYVFHLDPAVKWQNKAPANGRPLIADDVVFSLERIRTNDPRFINRTLLDSVDKIQATDPATVHITSKFPDASVLNNLAALSAKILAPEVVAKAGKFADADSVVGTGAFLLQSRDGTAAVLVKNPNYWRPGLPYLDGIVDKTFGDDESAWAAFTVGQLETENVPGSEAKKLFADSQKKYQLQWFKDVGWVGIQANLKKKPFDDPRVTRALRLLINHDEANTGWAEVYFGRGYLSAYLPAALDSWDLSEQDYRGYLEFKTPKDDAIKESLSQLSAAGFSKDKPLQFTLSGQVTDLSFSRAQTELCQSQLNQNGQGAVKADLKVLDEPHMRDALSRADFEYVITNLVAGQPFEVDSWFRTFNYTGGARNYGAYTDPALDQLVDKQRGVFDTTQRHAAVKDVLKYLMDHCPYTSWTGRYNPNAAQLKVQGFVPEGNSAVWGYHYDQVWLQS